MKKVKSYEFKPTIEDINRVSKEIREDLGLGECDCMKPKLEIDIEEAKVLLVWWREYDWWEGDKLAAKLENFISENQSLETKK